MFWVGGSDSFNGVPSAFCPRTGSPLQTYMTCRLVSGQPSPNLGQSVLRETVWSYIWTFRAIFPCFGARGKSPILQPFDTILFWAHGAHTARLGGSTGSGRLGQMSPVIQIQVSREDPWRRITGPQGHWRHWVVFITSALTIFGNFEVILVISQQSIVYKFPTANIGIVQTGIGPVSQSDRRQPTARHKIGPHARLPCTVRKTYSSTSRDGPSSQRLKPTAPRGAFAFAKNPISLEKFAI